MGVGVGVIAIALEVGVVVVVGEELQPWEKDGLGSSPNGPGAKMEGRCSSSSIFSSYPTYRSIPAPTDSVMNQADQDASYQTK